MLPKSDRCSDCVGQLLVSPPKQLLLSLKRGDVSEHHDRDYGSDLVAASNDGHGRRARDDIELGFSDFTPFWRHFWGVERPSLPRR
jgi:hypothetical protein